MLREKGLSYKSSYGILSWAGGASQGLAWAKQFLPPLLSLSLPVTNETTLCDTGLGVRRRRFAMGLTTGSTGKTLKHAEYLFFLRSIYAEASSAF